MCTLIYAGDLRRDESASNSVVITWQMSFEQIRKKRPSAADLLSLMSFFNPQGIPETVLCVRLSESTALGGSSIDDDDDDDGGGGFHDDLDMLLGYLFVKVTADSEVCEMHQLVQRCRHAQSFTLPGFIHLKVARNVTKRPLECQ
jgi:hypothetical protein